MTLIKRSLEDESHRYPHAYKNLQLCEKTKELPELPSQRMTTLNPSAKSTHDLRISGKRNQPHVKSAGSLLFVCLFFCLFYKVVSFRMAGRNCPRKCERSIIVRIEVSIEGTLVNRMENKKSRSFISSPIYC